MYTHMVLSWRMLVKAHSLHNLVQFNTTMGFVALYSLVYDNNHSLVDQPLHKRGRVWSTLPCGFVNVCHDFLGVLTTNHVHRCTYHLVLCTHANRIACIPYCVVWHAPNSPARKTSRITTSSIKLLVTPCTTCPLLSLQHKSMMRS